MTANETEWEQYNSWAMSKPSRDFLRRTIGLCALAGTPQGIAVDLGAGSGADTLELLQRGWTVHAVDSDEASLRLLVERTTSDLRERLHTHFVRFEDFAFPPCDLVWAGHSLPFCPRPAWPALWERIVSALAAGGRFAGDFFGDKHAFAVYDDVMLMHESDVRECLSVLETEAFDVEDGVRPCGGVATRWHAFSVTARKPVLHR